MSEFDAASTELSTNDDSEVPNLCSDCGCYKGKPCIGDLTTTIESSTVSHAKEETSTVEATPKTTSNITPFVYHTIRNKNIFFKNYFLRQCTGLTELMFKFQF